MFIQNIIQLQGPEKENKYVILGEKAKAQLVRDSKKDIELIMTELQKNPLNYTQVFLFTKWPHVKFIKELCYPQFIFLFIATQPHLPASHLTCCLI